MWGAEVYFISFIDISTPPGIPAVQKGEFQGPNQNEIKRIGARLSKLKFSQRAQASQAELSSVN